LAVADPNDIEKRGRQKADDKPGKNLGETVIGFALLSRFFLKETMAENSNEIGIIIVDRVSFTIVA
jgi:hypothetical protein